MERSRVARYAAPVAFLAAVTIGVVVIRAGFEHGKHHTRPPAATTTTKSTKHGHGQKTAHARKYTIKSGDTLAAIAAANGTTVAALVHLNPGIDPQALHVGQTIRVK